MNERIKELADEAAKFSAVMALPTGEPGDKLFVEKFAKLIAQDCITQIALYGISNFENDDIMWVVKRSIDVIKERYGVEE